jgi:hypothetical protein
MSERAKQWLGVELALVAATPLQVLSALAELADESGCVTAGIEAIADEAALGTATVKRQLARFRNGRHPRTVASFRRGAGRTRETDVIVLAPDSPQSERRPMKTIPKAYTEALS